MIQRKSFAQAVQNSCDVPHSQLPKPRIKGDEISIKIPEDEYIAGLEGCKNSLHGRLSLSKGDSPIKVGDLRSKLSALWKPNASWKLIPLGKGYYEFSFSSAEDLSCVWSIGSWNLNPGILRLFSWSPDFNPHLQKQTRAQCWVRILGLPQEYWRPKIVFAIANGIGVPIALDDATNKRIFGHFARVLIDIDLNGRFPDQILVEREDYAFFVGIEFEKIPSFYTSCQSIGHLMANCRNFTAQTKDTLHAKGKTEAAGRKVYVPKQKDIDDNVNLDNNVVDNLIPHENIGHRGDKVPVDPISGPDVVLNHLIDEVDVSPVVIRRENLTENNLAAQGMMHISDNNSYDESIETIFD